ncbi:Abi-alpha family protein [Bradyrhizobium sp. AZCC 2230]|uniref:Abi-alpha family protein n=1 Tax=Bradyrhizobium sp. AZCC 2230 TaxID=3117021 RepID=UPI002FF36B5D
MGYDFSEFHLLRRAKQGHDGIIRDGAYMFTSSERPATAAGKDQIAKGQRMSDDAPESAKALSNTVDLVREGGRAIGPAVGDIYGLLIGDRISAARKRRMEEIAHRAQKNLDDRDVKEKTELPESLAIPLLEAAQGESREELQALWARLLANAMDPSRAEDVRPEFVETVGKCGFR